MSCFFSDELGYDETTVWRRGAGCIKDRTLEIKLAGKKKGKTEEEARGCGEDGLSFGGPSRGSNRG